MRLASQRVFVLLKKLMQSGLSDLEYEEYCEECKKHNLVPSSRDNRALTLEEKWDIDSEILDEWQKKQI